MKTLSKQTLFLAILGVCLSNARAQVYLTDVVVFSTDSTGNWVVPDTWDTRPAGNFNVWIQNAGSSAFLNGPTDADVRPNLLVSPGSQAFRFLAAPGLDYSRFGINLFFNGSEIPSISAFGPMLTAEGPHSFTSNSSIHTPKPLAGNNTGYYFPGAGTLSFVSGNQLVTLTDFYWANQSVYGLDLIGQSTIGSDGSRDYVGGMTLSVTTVPEPQLSLWAMGLLAGWGLRCKIRKQ